MRKKASGIGPYQWAAIVFLLAVTISAALSLGSQILLSGAGLWAALVILIIFILLGIVFDMIGMAAASADLKILNSMASRKVRGAKEAIILVKNAGRVSSVCNDVIGDICGIVSGVTGAVIVLYLSSYWESVPGILLSVSVTAFISGFTIGGKALSKTYAIRRGTQVIWFAGRFLRLFKFKNKNNKKFKNNKKIKK